MGTNNTLPSLGSINRITCYVAGVLLLYNSTVFGLGIKEGVTLKGMSTEIIVALAEAEVLHRKLFDRELVVTEGMASRSYNSKHTTGNAFDMRIWRLTSYEKHVFLQLLRSRLGPQYDVVLEQDHIHVEYDPPAEEEL